MDTFHGWTEQRTCPPRATFGWADMRRRPHKPDIRLYLARVTECGMCGITGVPLVGLGERGPSELAACHKCLTEAVFMCPDYADDHVIRETALSKLTDKEVQVLGLSRLPPTPASDPQTG